MSWITSGVAVATAVLVSPAGLAASSAGLYPTSEETRAEFEAVCRQLEAGANPYFGRLVADRLERRLAAEQGSGTLGVESRVGLRGRLAEELLRLGEPGRAVELLEEALALATENGLGREIRGRLLFLLGLAHLQTAEDRNCVEMHDASAMHDAAAHGPAHPSGSCILPIVASAVHRIPEPGRRAAEYFLEYLELSPDDLQARWLLSLTRMVTGNYPDGVPERLRLPAAALRPEASSAPWKDRAAELGVAAFDLAGGAIVDDFDGDGLLDLVTSSWDLCEPMKAYRNTGPREDGTGGFVDVSREWGLDGQLGGINLVHADYDGDGRLDLLVLRGGWMGDTGRIRNSLLRNELRGEAARFVDVTAAVGLAWPAYPTQTAAWADFDGDGDLDLYVGNEAASSQVYSWSLVENPGRAFPSQLFLNQSKRPDGDRQDRSDTFFTDVARAAGVANLRYAKGVAWGDYDDDGDPDLYVSNIGPNRLYRNDSGSGDGSPAFVDVAAEAGVRAPETASFPTWFFDFDNDGDLDLFVAAYDAPMRRVSASYLGLGQAGENGHPVLYQNDGGTFRDVSAEVGLTRPLLPMGSNYGDLDNDGWLDLVLGTGIPDLEALMPDVVYRNGSGLSRPGQSRPAASRRRFVDVTFAIGLGHLQKGHGVAFGDLDNDGDQDLLHQMGGAFPADGFFNALYENPTAGARWITLALEGRKANRFGVGARIEVAVRDGAGERSIHLLAGSGGSFGGSSLQQEIGLGEAREIVRITVRWPGSGTVQEFGPVAMDRAYLAIEGAPELVPLDRPRFTLGG